MAKRDSSRRGLLLLLHLLLGLLAGLVAGDGGTPAFTPAPTPTPSQGDTGAPTPLLTPAPTPTVGPTPYTTMAPSPFLESSIRDGDGDVDMLRIAGVASIELAAIFQSTATGYAPGTSSVVLNATSLVTNATVTFYQTSASAPLFTETVSVVVWSGHRRQARRSSDAQEWGGEKREGAYRQMLACPNLLLLTHLRSF
jgi:hypothetical protein